MEAPAVLERYRKAIEFELHAFLDPCEGPLYRMLRYHMGWVDAEGRPTSGFGGKLLRPSLCLLACEAVGGDWMVALPPAAGVEFIHNFSLIHDDIQDKDTERHHRSTIWALWGEGHALTVGNCMAAVGHAAVLGLPQRGFPTGKVQQAAFLLSKACLEMIEGQTMDLGYEGQPQVAVEDYLLMVSKKTSALLACSLALGALAGEPSGRLVDPFWRSGVLLGLAFQIKDDLLGIWGIEEVTGKPSGNDIRRRKKSFPIVYGLAQARDSQQQELLRLYSTPEIDDDTVQQVLALLESLQVPYHGQRLVSSYCQQAFQELGGLALSHTALKDFQEILDFLRARVQ
jgi:geranylgeranyl diphosphate synthase type I